MDTRSPTKNHSANPFTSPSLRRYLLDKLDKIAGMQNSRVVYFDGSKAHEVRPHPPICQPNYLTIVIRPVNSSDIGKITQPKASVADKKDSRFMSELINASIGCGAATISWIVVLGSGAAVPASGGASSAITVLAWGAATASTAQCLNSAYRLYNESDYGDAEVNKRLDSQAWYEHTSTALDAISLAGGVASGAATLKLVLQLRKAGTSTAAALKGLTRQQRKQLTEEIIRAQHPGISNSMMKSLVAAGKYPKRYGKAEISNTVRLQLKDAIGAALGFTGSATSGILGNPGKVPDFAIAVIEEFESY